MEDMATYGDQEQDEELLPSLASVYQLYDDDKLQGFVDTAELLLDEDVELSRYHTIQLLILLANSVENPVGTREYYDRAQTEYRKVQLYHQESDLNAVRAIEVLGVKLDQVRTVVEVERAVEVRAALEMMDEDTVEESDIILQISVHQSVVPMTEKASQTPRKLEPSRWHFSQKPLQNLPNLQPVSKGRV